MTGRIVHVIVDNFQRDPWSIAAAIAAVAAVVIGLIGLGVGIAALRQSIAQTKLTNEALEAARKELALADAQLASTEAATKQTQEALELGRQQLEYMQRADIARTRALAPRLTARMEPTQQGGIYVMALENSGATAEYVLITGYNSDGKIVREFVQKIGSNELHHVWQFQVSGVGSYCQFIRIRSRDIASNRYITEYRSLGNELAYPVFREPWIGEGILPRPKHWSGEVSWDVEHFERSPGEPDEPRESGFDAEAPL